MRRFDPMRIREALRLRDMHLNNTEISQSIRCSRTTLVEVFKKCDTLNLAYEKVMQMGDQELDNLLYPGMNQPKIRIPDPDFPKMEEELRKYKNLNLRLIWKEYRQQTPQGLSYSQFCERYHRWKQVHACKCTMSIEKTPGEKMEVDWAGETPPLFCDKETGELQNIHLFVSSIGDSGYLYAEAFPNEKLNHWITAHTHALEYYGARPRIVVPDNTKTAVKKHEKYDPLLNPTYANWAGFNGVAVIPARPVRPQDKPSVEGGVRYAQTWILGRLRHRFFFSYEELNQAVWELLEELNTTPYQKRAGTRRNVFRDVDLPAMRPLSGKRFEQPIFKFATVGIHYHIEFEGTCYSVPFSYIHKKVTVRATGTMLEILYDNRRLCSHVRNYNPKKRYVTIPEHMPESHRKYKEQSQWDGKRFRSWGKQIGENTHNVIDTLLSSHEIEEQMYSSCMGILQLSNKYSAGRLESACSRACSLGGYSYKTIANILKNGQDQIPYPLGCEQIALPVHENIRGAAYYK